MIGSSRNRLGRRGALPLTADINVTSLMDIAFVLLIIFMITAPMLQGGVDVQLPRAVARPLTTMEALIISVDRAGRVFVDREGMTFEEFRANLPGIVASRSPNGAYVRGDSRAEYGFVLRVLAVLVEAGIADVGMVAEDERQ